MNEASSGPDAGGQLKICIVGAGAIGCWLGARLAVAGHEVSLVARGAHGEALRRRGVRLIERGRETQHPLPCTDNASELETQDVVFVTVKAHDGPAVAAQIDGLLDSGTVILPAVNGLPWWYFYALGGDLESARLQSVDPQGEQWERLQPQRVLGCVLYPAAEIVAPGVVRHVHGDRISIGEPDGSRSPRALLVSRVLASAAIRAPLRRRIRDEIWLKLCGNLAFNSISVLTGATLSRIVSEPATRRLARTLMSETAIVAESVGAQLPLSLDARLEGAAAVGEHKSSMLQDLEAHRRLEIDAILGTVQEVAGWSGCPVPTIDTVRALVEQRAHLAGCYD